MNKRTLKDGSKVDSLEYPVDLIIHTKAPGKWKLIDMETGEEYVGSDITTEFSDVLRNKVQENKVVTWVKTKWKNS